MWAGDQGLPSSPAAPNPAAAGEGGFSSLSRMQFPRRTPAPREPHEVVHEALLLYIINFLSISKIPFPKTPFTTNKINGFTRYNSISSNQTKGPHDLTGSAGYSPHGSLRGAQLSTTPLSTINSKTINSLPP